MAAKNASFLDRDPPVLRIVTSSFPQAQQGIPYSHTAVAENGTLPYVWSISSGGLPTGLTLDPSTGTVSGTPTTVEVATFSLLVTDAGGHTAGETFVITVNVPTLTITTKRLPYAQVGVPYNVALQTMGGSGGLTWSVIGGGLPNGLNLTGSTGTITGTVTAGATPSHFLVQVTDGSGTDSQRLAIEIDPANMTLVRVRQDGSADCTSLTEALSAGNLPNPILQTHVIEIDDDGTYTENVSVLFNSQTGSEWLSIRSAYDRLPTLQAANTASHVIHVQSNNVELRGLHIDGAAAACGVKVDDGLSGAYIVNCILTNNQTAIQAVLSTGIYIINNTCYGQEGIFASGGASAIIANNVVYATGPWAIQSGSCTADYNLYHAPAGDIGFDTVNVYANLAAWQASGVGGDANSLEGDPLFVNSQGGDFHLLAGSPGRDNGSSDILNPFWLIPVTDAEGYARATGTGFDMGAFETQP
ncbi:MAG: putative Ig domain-containing protein [Planctomycetota bacterium]|jgi:hypothetical protein